MIRNQNLQAFLKARYLKKQILCEISKPWVNNSAPVTITQSEFMRRMKDMSAMGGAASFYGNMPDHYNLVVNTEHPLVVKIMEDKR
jgi:hypothetical protein